MKFILAFSICSAITGFCNTPSTLPTEFNSWSECVGAGGKFIQTFSVEMKDNIETNKLYMNYFCNEIKYD
ncbi:hypothetical protein Eyrgjafa_gp_16 [Pelagibacter phage Eyrgjafa EXVC018P]|uniref:Lipoprotein n=1 Tax=Pelagibacter phage Eyrgjafa EXVC018P TaxID=2736227 RepID=A0A7S6C6B5_9CAUD|nr:hypothetical protein Eyrgjafa_gp_16 [Pelagibacter phage Eyrgjafa EXVC018P]QLF88221.1 hypothetical protein Gjalp_gp29 [Pelagibacter phage Gjalp EXVC020P]